MGNEVSSCVGGVAEGPCVHFGLCGFCGIVCAWASGGLLVANQHFVGSGGP